MANPFIGANSGQAGIDKLFSLELSEMMFTCQPPECRFTPMIKFSLKCDKGHASESWFKSGAACDDLVSRGLVTCPQCGSHSVQKALMAPALGTAKPEAPPPAPANPPELEQKLKALREHIETHSDYVGSRFAAEARAMYLGEVADRPIHGEARPAEARALLEDGIPVLPLPFVPSRNSN